MDTALAEAFLHRDHTVCGLKLAPFTLRHAFVLEAAGSPCALKGNDKITAADIVAAAVVCSRRNDAEIAALSAPGPLEIKVELSDEESAYVQWNDYLADYLTVPRLLDIPKGHTAQLHWLVTTAARLMRDGNFTKEEAWWTPIGEARWYALAFAEMAGAEFTIATDAMKNRLRRMGHNI